MIMYFRRNPIRQNRSCVWLLFLLPCLSPSLLFLPLSRPPDPVDSWPGSSPNPQKHSHVPEWTGRKCHRSTQFDARVSESANRLSLSSSLFPPLSISLSPPPPLSLPLTGILFRFGATLCISGRTSIVLQYSAAAIDPGGRWPACRTQHKWLVLFARNKQDSSLSGRPRMAGRSVPTRNWISGDSEEKIPFHWRFRRAESGAGVRWEWP